MSTLPSGARAKLSVLAQQADDASALTSAMLAQIQAAETRVHSALRELESGAAGARAEVLKAEVASLGEEIDRLRGVMGERRARSAAATQLVVRLRGWLHRGPQHMSFPLAPPT